MTLDEKFDAWFDNKFPPEQFKSLGGAFHKAMKDDMCRQAYKFGLEHGLKSFADTMIRSEINHYVTKED